MIGFIQPIIRTIFGITLLIPMPWRAGLIILIAGLLFRLTWRLLKWLVIQLARLIFSFVDFFASLLLLPEYFLNNILRQHGRKPILGTYTFDSVLQKIVLVVFIGTSKVQEIKDKFNIRVIWIILVACIPLILWFVRPYMEDSFAAHYVDYSASWWYSVENWARTGLWNPPVLQ